MIVTGAVIVVVLFVLIFVVYLRGGGKNPPGKGDDYRGDELLGASSEGGT